MSELDSAVTSNADYGAPCRYVVEHASLVWVNAGGRRVCGTCHPPARPELATWEREDEERGNGVRNGAPETFHSRSDSSANSMRAHEPDGLRNPQLATEARP